jgi:hypothetical protein
MTNFTQEDIEAFHESIRPRKNIYQILGDFCFKLSFFFMFFIVFNIPFTVIYGEYFDAFAFIVALVMQFASILVGVSFSAIGHKIWMRELDANAEALNEKIQQYLIDRAARDS